MSCGMVVASFRPQTPAILPVPSAVLEGISKTGRFVPLSFRILLLTWAVSKSDAAFAIPALIEVRFFFFTHGAKSLTVRKAWSKSLQSVNELKRLKALVINSLLEL